MILLYIALIVYFEIGFHRHPEPVRALLWPFVLLFDAVVELRETEWDVGKWFIE